MPLAAPAIASSLFPAWAGVILEIEYTGESSPPIPRMGGGDPASAMRCSFFLIYSPHGRG